MKTKDQSWKTSRSTIKEYDFDDYDVAIYEKYSKRRSEVSIEN